MCGEGIHVPILVDKDGYLYLSIEGNIFKAEWTETTLPKEKLHELRILGEIEALEEYGGLEVNDKLMYDEEGCEL